MSSSLMSAPEVAELLGVPISWVYERSRRGQIPTVTLGRYRRYRREAIEAWVEELELHGHAAGNGGPPVGAGKGARSERSGFDLP